MKRTGCRMRDAGCVIVILVVLTLPASPIPLPAQRPQPFDQQLRDNQQRLESIRRERSDVEQELERLRTQVHSLSDELANIERQKETTNRIVNERTEELDRYLALEHERQTSLRETRRSAREALQRLSELERDEKSLNDRIVALERARREAEARGAATAAAITTADLGQLDWPVQGRIVYQFGTATGPNNTRIPWHGIGIAAPAGTPVRAIAGGTVSLAGLFGTYLRSVLIDHGGGYYSFYGYLSDATVTQGERVIKGQLVGHVGGGSSDQGPHLHFEIRGQGGIALDPVNWLKTRR